MIQGAPGEGVAGFHKIAAIQKDKNKDATPGKTHEITLNRKVSKEMYILVTFFTKPYAKKARG